MTCRMGKPIRTGVRVCMPRIGMGKVCMPIIGNRSAYKAGGDDVLKDLKSHMLGWYDVKRQGCTNESLAENPVMEDLSGKNHPLELKNFEFGGLSGIGSYGTDLTKWVNYSLTIPVNKYSVDVPTSVVSDTPVNFTLRASNLTYFRAKCSIDGVWYAFVRNTNFRKEICRASSGESVEVYFNSKDFSTIPQGELLIYFDSRFTGYTLEILPNFPNSLVFNGVTPEYVINKNNVTLGNVVTAIGVNKFKVTGNHFRALSLYKTGKAGESLTVSIPSFMVKILGLEEKSLVQIDYKNSEGNAMYRNLVADGHYVIPAINYTLDAKEDGSAIRDEAIRILTDGNIHDVTLEFLPNYPKPTTKMYGIIPTLTHGAKCMMMDFVPTFPMEYTGFIEYYTQRQIQAGNQYALMTDIGGLTKRAYNNYNSNGTYINGQYNDKLRHVDLLNKRQVVSVNAEEVYEMPANRGVVIAADESLTGYFPTMALNSLILFDRELTEEEMKLVMDKLMKYEDTDNIAGDLSRSASVLSLDDSDMYEEYDVYEEGNGVQDIWEME